MLRIAGSVPVCFGRLDDKSRFPCQHEQIFVARDQQISFAALRQIQKYLVLRIPASDGAVVRHSYFASIKLPRPRIQGNLTSFQSPTLRRRLNILTNRA